MSDNYYIVLGLDPSCDDWTVIRKSIDDHKLRWSRDKTQGAPAAKRVAAANLPRIKDMEAALSDPARRKAIAREALEELRGEHDRLLEKLDSLIKLIPEVDVLPDVVKTLLAQVPGLSEDEVVDSLKRKGKKIEASAAKKTRKVRPQIDPAIATELRGLQGFLKIKTLYDFLGLSPQSSPKVLYDRADEIYKQIRKDGLIDPVSTARQDLTGKCKALFKDQESKEKYDNTVAMEVMNDFSCHLKLAGGDGILDVFEIQGIIQQAVESGVAKDLALEFIEDYCSKHNLKVQRDVEKAIERNRTCGFCRTVATNPDDKRCHSCGKELVLPCPRCGQPTPTEDESCAKCGFHTGDLPFLESLLKEAGLMVAAGDFADALRQIDKVLVHCPDWDRALEARKKATEGLETSSKALASIESLVRARKFEAAFTALSRLRDTGITAPADDLKRKVDVGTGDARRLYEEGQAHLKAGRQNDAVVCFIRSLDVCVDFSPAVAALAKLPPPAPTGFNVAVGAHAASLSWNAISAAGTVSYKVVRKSGGKPLNPDDGQELCNVLETRCDDTGMTPGTPWHYSVYSVRGGVCSSAAATSGPHLRVADVESPRVECGDGTVSISFRRPGGCQNIEVSRFQGMSVPAGTSGRPVPLSGNSIHEQGLTNDTDYCYRIVACFRDPINPSAIVRSPGVSVCARPVAPPPAIMNLIATRSGQDVSLSWTPPARGSVQVVLAQSVKGIATGSSLPLSDVEQLGKPVALAGSSSARVKLDGQGRYYFVPLSVMGTMAVVGKPAVVTLLDEVTALSSSRQGNAISLSWDWPEGAQDVLVVWSYSARPLDPAGPFDGSAACSRATYDVAAHWELRNALPKKHFFTIFVHDPRNGIYSGGASIIESTGLETRVSYQVRTKKALLTRAVQEAWVEFKGPNALTLPSMVAALNPSRPPLRASDGREVGQAASLVLTDGVGRLNIDVSAGKGFVKVFFKEASDARDIRLMPAAQENLEVG